MADNKVKIKFYSLNGETVDVFSVRKNDILDFDKDIKTNKNFNDALKNVIEKDMNSLSNKIANVVKSIIKKLAKAQIIVNNKLDDNISNIDSLIKEIESLISSLTIEKNSIKIYFFTANKKAKRERIKNLENVINFLSKTLNNIISIKDEYYKLVKRKKGLETFIFDGDDGEKEEVDPLERTINFYMTKNNK